jgi:hypothetical protein
MDSLSGKSKQSNKKSFKNEALFFMRYQKA